jgi:hypothetical protein
MAIEPYSSTMGLSQARVSLAQAADTDRRALWRAHLAAHGPRALFPTEVEQIASPISYRQGSVGSQACLIARKKNRTNSLGCLSVGRRKDADSLGERHKFRQGSDLHFLHHPVAVGFNGPLGRAQRVADLLVGLTANDKLEDFALARRQRREMPANDV